MKGKKEGDKEGDKMAVKKQKNKKEERRIQKKRRTSPYQRKLNLKEVDWERIAKIFEPEKETILQKIKNEVDRYPYVKEILYLLAGGAVLAGFFVTPRLAGLAAEYKKLKIYERRRLKETIKRLKKQKLVEIIERGGERIVRITKEGRVRALRYKLDEMKIKKPKKWDGKWRIVIFDIFEKRRGSRDIFRRYLKQLGLKRIQQSVYVYPYPCFDEIEFLRQIFYVGKGVRYVVADRIEEDGDLRIHFKLLS